jgi:hypothetical protein
MDDFKDSIEKVNFPSYLILGRRWNLGIDYPIDFSNEKWKNSLLNSIKRKAS